MSNKRKATTVHGEFEYETVECSSCGNEVAKDDAQRFVIGDVVEREDWRAIGKIEYNFAPASMQTGWACEYCQNDGPIDFPEWSLLNRIKTVDPMSVILPVSAGLIVIVTLITIIVAMIGAIV